MYRTSGRTTEQIRSIPKRQQQQRTNAENGGFVATTVPMNTSSTIETHQLT
jgi:hypothetical protein